jgi:Chromo (CHRromatin Organisation MOdifier) domain
MPSHGPNFTWPPPDLFDGEAEYEVEQICAHWRWGRGKTLQYLIKWKGYPESDNTWENANQIHAPTLIKLYHRTNALDSLKAQRIQLKQQQSPTLSPPKAFSHSTTSLPTIIRNSTAALVWSDTPKDNTRSACSLNPTPLVQSPSTLSPCTTLLESCAILMELTSTLQTSTVSNDNLLYAPCHLTPNPSRKCLPLAHTMHQTNHQPRLLSNFLPSSS